jgi:hypothetical protein
MATTTKLASRDHVRPRGNHYRCVVGQVLRSGLAPKRRHQSDNKKCHNRHHLIHSWGWRLLWEQLSWIRAPILNCARRAKSQERTYKVGGKAGNFGNGESHDMTSSNPRPCIVRSADPLGGHQDVGAKTCSEEVNLMGRAGRQGASTSTFVHLPKRSNKYIQANLMNKTEPCWIHHVSFWVLMVRDPPEGPETTPTDTKRITCVRVLQNHKFQHLEGSANIACKYWDYIVLNTSLTISLT